MKNKLSAQTRIFTVISLVLLGTSFASAKVDCSPKMTDRTFVTPKDCPMLTIKAWGGGAAGKGNHGYGGAYATSDFEIPSESTITIHIGQGGKKDVNGGDGESTTVSYKGQPLLLALGGQNAETDSCIAYPQFQRGMSHYEYAKDAKPANTGDEDYQHANARAAAKHGYSWGVDGKEGICGVAVIKCKKDIKVKL